MVLKGLCCCRPELFPFTSCIFYAVVMAMVSLDRVSLKKRVVDAPEILTVIEDVPDLASYLNSLYRCKYSEFFQVGLNVTGMPHVVHETAEGKPSITQF